MIYIPCHNRRRIAEQCIPTVRAGMAEGDLLSLWNDGSTEYDDEWLRENCRADEVRHPLTESANLITETIGIERQRREHFLNFIYRQENYTHAYLTDADALHDPGWRSKALELQDDCGGAPVCLYNTKVHADMIGNTIEDHPDSNVIWRRVAPGISYLLTYGHMWSIFGAIKNMPDPLHWDWTVPTILGHRMAISAVSYVDHIGHGGLHHPASEGFDGGDRALNPTPWLVKKRAEVVAKLNAS